MEFAVSPRPPDPLRRGTDRPRMGSCCGNGAGYMRHRPRRFQGRVDRKAADTVQKGGASRRGSGIYPLGRPGGGVDRVPPIRFGPSLGYSGHGLPAEGLAGTSCDSSRKDGELLGDCSPDRNPPGSSCRCPCMRFELSRRRHPLSQGCAEGRRSGWLPLGNREKTCSA